MSSAHICNLYNICCLINFPLIHILKLLAELPSNFGLFDSNFCKILHHDQAYYHTFFIWNLQKFLSQVTLHRSNPILTLFAHVQCYRRIIQPKKKVFRTIIVNIWNDIRGLCFRNMKIFFFDEVQVITMRKSLLSDRQS